MAWNCYNRTKANVDLSSAGEGLLGYARRILTLNDEAVGKLRERRIEGVVRLGVMDDYGTLIVPPLLASFVACYPLVHIEMETGLTSSMPSRLGNAYDLVIAMHPEGSGEGEFLRREQAAWATRRISPSSNSRARCRLRFIRRVPVPKTGRSEAPSMPSSGRGDWLSSAKALRPSSRLRAQGLCPVDWL